VCVCARARVCVCLMYICIHNLYTDEINSGTYSYDRMYMFLPLLDLVHISKCVTVGLSKVEKGTNTSRRAD